jgi:hypothetical protein
MSLGTINIQSWLGSRINFWEILERRLIGVLLMVVENLIMGKWCRIPPIEFQTQNLGQ